MTQLRVGDAAPDVTLVNADRQEVKISQMLGGPLVLAFFPGAFTGTCTRELCTFRDSLSQFEGIGGRIAAISVDTPYAQKAFADANRLTFPLLSDFNRRAVKAFGIEDPNFAKGVLPGVAKRSVFVLDGAGKITYGWVSDDSGVEPNYEEVRRAVQQTAEGAHAPR